MHQLFHLCGQPLERTSGPAGALQRVGRRAVDVEHCPRCGARLFDIDMCDADGVPLVGTPAGKLAQQRRVALADLAFAGYTFWWDAGIWRISLAGQDEPFASFDDLEAMIALASALSAGQTLIRMLWRWPNSDAERIWHGVYSASTGRALGHADDEPNELVMLAIDGERVELHRRRGPVQIGRIRQRSERLIELDFVVGQLKGVLTTAEVAEHYGVHVSTVIRWCQRGLFPNGSLGPKIGRGAIYLIPASDLEGFVPPEQGRLIDAQRRSRQRLRSQADSRPARACQSMTRPTEVTHCLFP